MSRDAAIARLQTLLRIPTISRHDLNEVDWPQFEHFLSAVSELYPLVHTRLKRELVAGHSMLFHWAGRSATEPSVLMAHYDVVAATDAGWRHPPFEAELSGKGADRLIWGRGTLDNKGAVASILEAVETRLAEGLVPAQDIYLVFTHNEETSGAAAIAIVDLLEKRGIRPALVLDEGGAIVEGVFPGVKGQVAVVGVSEKGAANVRLTVDEQGGHASTPPPLTATVRLSRAIVRLNDHPFPASFSPTAIDLFHTLGRRSGGFLGWVFRNIAITKPLVLRHFVRTSDELRAMVRTTQAVTVLDAGQALNALAERASAVVNVRLAVGDTVDSVIAHITKAVADPMVKVELMDGGEAAPVSPVTGLSWELLRSTIEKSYPGILVTPYVQNGATDSRQFTRISRGVYRFTPFEMSKEERDTLHAKNERMHVATYLRAIEFYRALVAAL